MGLNIVSNYAANVAHRNLTATDAQATSSLAKLSSGTRVVSAKDDAAAMAIGSRISSEVAGLKQASVNAGQAASMLQIADGAMGKTSDILTRMKTLAVQAGSDQLGDTERAMLDTEYQSLVSEVDRIAGSTTFNGQSLVAGQAATELNTGTLGTSLEAADGFAKIEFNPDVGAASFTVAYDDDATGTGVLTVTNTTTGESQGIDLELSGAGAIAANSERTIDFSQLGVSITLNSAFADTDITATNTMDSVVNAAADSTFNFKIGAGTTANDTVAITIGATTSNALGLTGTDITTSANADTALDAINGAIDDINTKRANVGASQNRLEFAAANLASTIENQEAARSSLLDLDVAAEMTKFTSKQILMQAGVSMLAQANQMPQNMMRLFG
ncbi:flagellin [Constrictibacter sp. MBR-5]|jgi:flagellin|uniref:flagellin n=1 Tax=Constrictibacter sp. MBR-5 TaxID=3156467 RepID=UPI0033998C10